MARAVNGSDAPDWPQLANLALHHSCCMGSCRPLIPCSNYEKVSIGQTGRTLEHRMKEHRRALTSGNLAQSALAEHAADRGHAIDWGSAEVVDSHQQFHQRCLLESWHIRSQDTTLNREEGNLPRYTTNSFPEQDSRTPPQGPTD